MPSTRGAVAAPAAAITPGKYDALLRRRGIRRGRERGCWLYVPLEELAKTGIDPYGPVPWYRVWGSTRGRLVVQFYRNA